MKCHVRTPTGTLNVLTAFQFSSTNDTDSWYSTSTSHVAMRCMQTHVDSPDSHGRAGQQPHDMQLSLIDIRNFV